jgi:hypothetical protein
MSFADLHSARRPKQARSYVNTAAHTPAISTKEPATSSAESSDEVNFHTVVEDAIYRPLPVSLQMRLSNTSGRGLWMKDKVTPGALYSMMLLTSF